jgi:uncharacterized protein (DUF342 family)/DNA-binding response OmpR family regulator
MPMTKVIKPKVLIVESCETARNHLRKILVEAGWDVVYKQTAAGALDAAKNSKSSPFVLMISSYKMPKMDGDEILRNIKKISVFTQRMLIFPVEEKKALVNAINTANINACISYSFKDDDLISQAETCYEQFQQAVKTQRFKRLTKRQNIQLYEAAKNLKEKEKTSKNLIKKKKTRILLLKSQKRLKEKVEEPSFGITLAGLIEHKKVALQPESFLNEFLSVCEFIKTRVHEMASRHSLEWEAPDLNAIINNELEGVESVELVENIKKSAYISSLGPGSKELGNKQDTYDAMDQYLELTISDDNIKAWLKKKKNLDADIIDLTAVLDFLRNHQVSYGIADDKVIEAWIRETDSLEDKINIATGETPVAGQDGTIEYQFERDYTNPGKIQEDGSIDFRDRGDVPFVKQGDLLANKTPPREGSPGINISGIEIPVEQVVDPFFVSGPGTILSDDNLSITADIDGQPHVDAMGNVTVNAELLIKGNVDFETGNISFGGNIIVKGTIKEGFVVKAVNLTANEIEGATIDLTGDLSVSNGITKTTIKTLGNIYTKFIHDSTVSGFGDFTVQKEILDSSIFISGSCQIPTGKIIASTISAKKGIEAKDIGTLSSKPQNLRVGIDDHIEMIKKHNNAALEDSLKKIADLKNKIKDLNEKDKKLHQAISENAYIQDRSQLEIKQCKKQLSDLKLSDLEISDNKASLQKLSAEIKELKKKTAKAESEIDRLFEVQDNLGLDIAKLTKQINFQEEKNITYMNKKKSLVEHSGRNKPDPKVCVSKTIIQRTKIVGPNSSIILTKDRSRCIIQEVKKQEGIMQFFEMEINDL